MSYFCLLILCVLNITCQQGALVKGLCCNYIYLDQGKDSKSILPETYNGKGVHANVIQYVYNSAFILILQKPVYEDHLYHLSSQITREDSLLTKNDEMNIQISKHKADSILKNDEFYKKIFSRQFNLWIISKNNLYGPLDLNEYYQKRIELAIPEGLYLKL